MIFIAIIRPESTRIWNDVKISQSHLLSHWNFTQDETMSVETYTTGEEAELFLNNKSLGAKQREGKPGEGPRLVWSMPFEPGMLTAVARTRGKEIARYELKTAGEPAKVRLTPDRTVLKADGQDLSHIMVEVLDAHGTVVPDASHLVKFEVTGAGLWRTCQTLAVAPGQATKYRFPDAFQAYWVRVVADTDCTATAEFHYEQGVREWSK